MSTLMSDNEDDTREELNLPNGTGADLLRNDSVWSRFKCLKKLDLNGSDLSTLPPSIDALQTLEILFLSENKFESFPSVFGKLSNLRMLSLRGNKLTELSTSNLPKHSLVWLILTNNRIKRMDPNIGELKRLRKLMLSHNELSSIPPEISGCTNLELIRLANNQINCELPREFLCLPKLAWISLAGNPISHCPKTKEKEIPKLSVSYDETSVLGCGASGTVYSGTYNDKNVAVKIFKEKSTGSDGTAEDEAAINALVDHPLAVSAIGVFLCDNNENHEGMVMELLEGAKAIGRVPSFDTVTRDAGPTEEAKDLNKDAVFSIIYNVATALEHVHDKAHVSNGDIYLHNILMCNGGVARMSDWGASFVYDENHDYAKIFERIEVLAFGRLVQDLFDWHLDSAVSDLTKSGDLGKLIDSILDENQMKRPSFKEIKSVLSGLPEFARAKTTADQFINSRLS
eukprot:scaffold10284_cov61-Cyclotella_meneghiniana.AAC.6